MKLADNASSLQQTKPELCGHWRTVIEFWKTPQNRAIFSENFMNRLNPRNFNPRIIIFRQFFRQKIFRSQQQHRISTKIFQIPQRTCSKLPDTYYLRFCPRKSWKVDFRSENSRVRRRYRFHFEWFSKLIVLNYTKSQIDLGIKF